MGKLKRLVSALVVFSLVITVLPIHSNAQPVPEKQKEEQQTEGQVPEAAPTVAPVPETEAETPAPATPEAEGETEAETPAAPNLEVIPGTEVIPETEIALETEQESEPETEVDLPEGTILNDETGIPDSALYKAILKALGKEETGTFTADEAETVRKLDASNTGVVDFTGLYLLYNLDYLDISNNGLNELTNFPYIGLETFILNNNNLTTLDIFGDIYPWSLKYLEISNNQLTDVSGLSNFTNLEILDLSYNSIQSFEGISTYYLREFDISHNELYYLTSDFYTWDITHFNISHNKLAVLPDFSYNGELSPDFENDVPVVNIAYNKFTKVEILRKMPAQLTDDNPWIEYNSQQDADEQKIIRNDKTGIPDPALYAAILEEGDIDKNGILTEDEASYITYLHIGWSNTTERYFEIYDLTGIHYLVNLYSLRIEYLMADDLSPLLLLENLYSLNLYNTKVINMDIIKKLNLESLTLNWNDTDSDFSLDGLEEMVSLKYFSLSLPAGEFSKIIAAPNLERLEVNVLFDKDNTSISTESLHNLKSLETLYIYGNSVYEDIYDENGWWIDYFEHQVELELTDGLRECTNLNDITINGVSIIDESKLSILGELPSLQSLAIDYCNIKDISYLSNVSNLTYLSLSGNQIEDISPLTFLNNSPDLDTIDLANNKIKDISVFSSLNNLSSLYYLTLGSNEIENISSLESLAACSNLHNLRLNDNKIKDISSLRALEYCTKLSSLYLSDNEIEDISPLTVLKNSENLYYLGLSHNYIKDLTPLSELKYIESFHELSVNNNGLTDLSGIEELIHLTDLNVANNNLTTLPDLSALVNLHQYWTHFYGNLLTAEELKAKMPEHLALNQTWINNNRYDDYEWFEEIIEEYDPEVIVDLLEDETVSSVTVVMEEAETVDEDVFKKAAETGKTVSFDVVNDDGATVYQWSFDGNDISNPNMDIDLSMSFETEAQEEIEALTGQADALYLSFNHHGDLPGPATMTVFVGNKYNDGDIVYLYYYRDDNGVNEIELMAGGLYVENGYVTFTITHCSDYFLLDEELDLEEDDNNSGNENNGSDEDNEDDKGNGNNEDNEDDKGNGNNEDNENNKGNGNNNGNGSNDKDDTDGSKDKTQKPKDIESEKIDPTEIISELRSSTNNGVNVILNKPDRITPDILKAIQETGKTAVFSVVNKGKTLYEWKFDGKNLKNTDLIIDMSISFQSDNKDKIEKLIKTENVLFVSFAYHGELPGKTDITVYVGDTFKNGQTIYLYYYNEETSKLEEVTPNGVKVKDGYVTFTLDHCSDYVLIDEKIVADSGKKDDTADKTQKKDTKKTTAKKASSTTTTPKTDDSTNISLLLLLMAAAGFTLLLNEKRRRNSK